MMDAIILLRSNTIVLYPWNKLSYNVSWFWKT